MGTIFLSKEDLCLLVKEKHSRRWKLRARSQGNSIPVALKLKGCSESCKSQVPWPLDYPRFDSQNIARCYSYQGEKSSLVYLEERKESRNPEEETMTPSPSL